MPCFSLTFKSCREHRDQYRSMPRRHVTTLRNMWYLQILVEGVDKCVPDLQLLWRNDVVVIRPVGVVLTGIAFINVDYIELARHFTLLTVTQTNNIHLVDTL